jgi:hypothetical protein
MADDALDHESDVGVYCVWSAVQHLEGILSWKTRAVVSYLENFSQ